MTQINNSDRILLQLRLQLQKLKEGQRTGVRAASPKAKTAASQPLERLRRLAKADSSDEGELERLIIASLLTEEFGASVANDAKFQQLTKDVLETISRDPETEGFLKKAIAALRSA
jgi:hypothetical protein